MRRSVILVTTLFAALSAISMLCTCKSRVNTDSSLQITQNDVIHLDGSFEENFLESWEYVFLEDDNPDALMGYVEGVLYDDSLFFVMADRHTGGLPQIKVFDRQGHYLHNIGHIGRAKNEYLSIFDCAIDIDHNEIIILDALDNSIKRYDYQGNFLGKATREPTTITDGFLEAEFVKYLSNGSIINYSSVSIVPIYDCYMLTTQGKYRSPFVMTDYRTYCEMDPMEFFEHTGDMPGIILTSCHSNIRSDSTYLLRTFDNHIYLLANDSVECLANMAFMPEMPDKVKHSYECDNDELYDGYIIPDYFYDMKDYLYIWYYYDNEYLYEKSTSKMYHINHDTLHVSVPRLSTVSICDNTIIGCAADYDIHQALTLMDSKDYDHRYTPQLESFFRKADKRDNAAIVIAHYK